MYDMKKTVKIVLYDTVADPVQIKIFPYIPSPTVVKIVDNPMTKVRISSIDKKSYVEKHLLALLLDGLKIMLELVFIEIDIFTT